MDLSESNWENGCRISLLRSKKNAFIKIMEPIVHTSPLPRRSHTQYPESPDAAIQPIWTTARCNRLLRPLSSKIALLRKSQALSAKRECGGRKDLNSKISHSIYHHGAFPADKARAAAKVVCQASITPNASISDWAPSPRPRKRIKRTYSSKELGHGLNEEPAKPEASTSTAKIFEFHPESLIEGLSYGFKVDKLCPLSEEQKIFEKSGLIRVHSLGQNVVLSTEMRVEESFRRFLKLRYPDGWQLIEGIQNGLETLLKVTTNNEVGNPFGARSLFSTCLKSVPQYISAEEKLSETEDPENKVDVSSAVYSELEAYESSPSGGWKPLKEVVRAHGVAMLGSAVKDGLIELPVASNLVRICLNRGAFDEGQHLVECMIGTMQNILKSASIKGRILGYGLSVLDQFASFSGRFGFQFRQLADIFRNGNIPIEWILSDDMSECWSRVMRSITDGDSASRDAGILLQTVALMASGVSDISLTSKIHNIRLHLNGLPNTVHMKSCRGRHADKVFRYPHPGHLGIENMKLATQTMNSKLLAAVCAIDLLQSSTVIAGSEDLPKTCLQVLQAIVLQACQVLELHIPLVDSEKSKPNTNHFFIPLLAAGVSSAVAGNSGSGLGYYLDIIKGVNLSQEFFDSAVSFLCAVAKCCGRATSNNGFQYIQKITQELVDFSTSSDCEAATRMFIGNVAASTAIQYSRSTSMPKHLSWALEIESLVNRMTVGVDGQTPGKSLGASLAKPKPGFRWEEGICEWVAGTPRVSIPKPTVYKDQDITSPSPDLDHKIASATALQISPIKAPTCLAEVSVTSPKLNSKAVSLKNKSDSLENQSYVVFLNVEIDNSRRVNALTLNEGLKRKLDSLNDSQSPGVMIKKPCTLEGLHEPPQLKAPRPKASRSCVEYEKSRCPEHEKRPSDQISACVANTGQTVRKPSLVAVELRIDQDTESADELSFS